MSIPPVGSSRQGSYEGAKGGQLPQLPVGTPVSALIVARLQSDFFRLITQFGPLLVQADAETAARLPASGTLHLAVAGHERGGIQLHVLPEEGARPAGPLPLLREVTGQAAQKVLQGQPQISSPAPPQTSHMPQAAAGGQAPQPALQSGAQLPATLILHNGQQQLITPQGAFRPETPLPFPPEAKLVLIPQPGGRSVSIVPLAPQGQGRPANPYLAASGQNQPQLLADKAVEVPLNSLRAVAPPQPDASQLKSAVESAVRTATSVQGSAAALFQSLSTLASAPAASAQGAALAALAAQVLGLRLSPEKGITAESLRSAFQRSGAGHEALLARGQLQTASGDLKSLLMHLLDGLKAAPEAKAASQLPRQPIAVGQPLPPQRGTLFEAPPSQLGPAGAASPPSLPQVAEEAEAALSRLKLLQLASLPEGGEGRTEAPGREGAMRREMQLEIPLALYGGRTSMMQVHVESEGRGTGEDAQEGRDWRLSFSLQLGAQGAVNAQVNMRLARFGVLLWAEDGELRGAMRESLPRLSKALKEMGVELVELEIRKFPLPHARGQRPGLLMDAVS